MSAALSVKFADPSTLDRLTCARPSADDIRFRATFWRAYAAANPELVNPSQAHRIGENCAEMDAIADRMDSPALVVALPAPKSRKSVKKASTLTASEFWSLHSEAVQAIRAECGDRWHLIGETVTGTIPAKLASMVFVGAGGTKTTIRWRRDHRLPAARYWPGGTIPAEVSLAPVWVPSSDFHAAERDVITRTNAARLDQIAADKVWRAEASQRKTDVEATYNPRFPRMLAKGEWDDTY